MSIKLIRSAVGSMPAWSLIEELQKHGVEVIGIDSSPYAYGHYLLHKSYIVPKGDDDKFIPVMMDIVKRERPNAILTGPEEEMLKFSKNREIFEDLGTKILLPDYKAVLICTNKQKTHSFFKKNNIPTPDHYKLDQVNFPCVIKPACGRGGKGVYVVHNQSELIKYLKFTPEPVIQKFIDGYEYSIDILSEKGGEVLSIIPRLRLMTESGVSIRSITIHDEEIENYCRKIVKKLNLFGPSCIQCIKTNDAIYFLEINLRFGGGSILSFKADPFLLKNFIHLISGKSTIPNLDFKENLLMLRYYSEVFIEKDRILYE